MKKTFLMRIHLADGAVLTRQVTAYSYDDLKNKLDLIAKEYLSYVRSEGSLVEAK